MRQDQYEKLQKLQDKILDVFIEEADPEHWPGKGLKIGAMDAQTRGDLYWVRKTAVSAAMLFNRVEAMVHRVQLMGAGTAPPVEEGSAAQQEEESQLDQQVRAAEKEGARLMRELQTGVGKSKFMKDALGTKGAHGKAAS